MTDDVETRTMLAKLFVSTGLDVTEEDLNIAVQLHGSFAVQRDRLADVARPETEPMIIPAFDRVQTGPEATDERRG